MTHAHDPGGRDGASGVPVCRTARQLGVGGAQGPLHRVSRHRHRRSERQVVQPPRVRRSSARPEARHQGPCHPVEVARRLHPEPAGVRQVRRRDHDRRRLPDDGCDGRCGDLVPEQQVRDRRRRRDVDEAQAEERPGSALQGAGGWVSRRLCGGSLRQGDGRQGCRLGRRSQDPAGRPVHRRLPVRRQEGVPGHQGAQRLLPGLRRTGEVQGEGAEPDRPGLGRRVPGRRPVRPRRPRCSSLEEGVRHRRRRRPGLPRPARHDECAQEGRHRRVHGDHQREERHREGRHQRHLRCQGQRRRLRQVEPEGSACDPAPRSRCSPSC